MLQLGGVIVDDDVEIGANTTIDRSSLRNTVIGVGTRLDNLVQLAHNAGGIVPSPHRSVFRGRSKSATS